MMTLFDQEGRLSRGLSQWIPSLVSAAGVIGALVTVYVSIASQNAVQDERIHALQLRMDAIGPDHDGITRIEVRLAAIERLLAERETRGR